MSTWPRFGHESHSFNNALRCSARAVIVSCAITIARQAGVSLSYNHSPASSNCEATTLTRSSLRSRSCGLPCVIFANLAEYIVHESADPTPALLSHLLSPPGSSLSGVHLREPQVGHSACRRNHAQTCPRSHSFIGSSGSLVDGEVSIMLKSPRCEGFDLRVWPQPHCRTYPIPHDSRGRIAPNAWRPGYHASDDLSDAARLQAMLAALAGDYRGHPFAGDRVCGIMPRVPTSSNLMAAAEPEPEADSHLVPHRIGAILETPPRRHDLERIRNNFDMAHRNRAQPLGSARTQLHRANLVIAHRRVVCLEIRREGEVAAGDP